MSSRPLLGFAAAVLVGAIVMACSGATETGLLGGGAPGSSEFASEPAGESNGNNGSPTSTSGASLPPSDNGASSSSSSSSSSGGSTSSGGTSTSSSSSGGTKDASVPPPAGKIYCGATSCGAPNEICCISGTFGGGAPTLACEQAGLLACVGNRSIACDDSADCPSGQVCCGQLGDQGYGNVECRTQCKNGPGTRGVRFCDPAAAVDECASIGKACGNSQQMPGYHVCI